MSIYIAYIIQTKYNVIYGLCLYNCLKDISAFPCAKL